MSPVIYRGHRPATGPVVVEKQIDDLAPVPLNMRNDLRDHSPDGAEWGYGGSGPAQLSLALLADVMGDDMAEELYQRYKREVVAALPHEGFVISAEAIEQWAKEHEAEES